MTTQQYDLVRVDSGNFRIYYRPRGARGPLYCIQNEGGWGVDRFTFCRCSADGEPEYGIKMPEQFVGIEFDEISLKQR